MSSESAIYNRLSNYSGLTALVSTRIYPLNAPQNVTAPCVTYQRISSGRPSAMGEDIGIVRASVQIDCWASGYDSARSVAEQVRAALQRLSGTYASTVIQVIFLVSEREEYEDGTKLYRVTQDYEINYEE